MCKTTKTNCHSTFNLSDRLLLLRYLKVYDFDLEKSKQLLLVNLEMRQKNPNLFENRDLLSDDFQELFKHVQVFPMKRTTPKGHKLTIFYTVDSDTSKYTICRYLSYMLAGLDTKFVSFVTDDIDEPAHDGEIFINDLQNFGFKNMMQFVSNPSLLNSYLKYSQEATPMKMIQNHFINCSSVIPKLMTFIKPFLNKKVADSLNFHSNLDTLHAMVPKECLPEEHGGTAGKRDDLNREWMEVLMSKR